MCECFEITAALYFQEKYADNLVCDTYHWKLLKTCWTYTAGICLSSSPEKMFGLLTGKDK